MKQLKIPLKEKINSQGIQNYPNLIHPMYFQFVWFGLKLEGEMSTAQVPGPLASFFIWKFHLEDIGG